MLEFRQPEMILVGALGAEDQREMAFEIEIRKPAKKHPSREDLEKAIEKAAEAHHDLSVAAHNEWKWRPPACWIASERVTCIAS